MPTTNLVDIHFSNFTWTTEELWVKFLRLNMHDVVFVTVIVRFQQLCNTNIITSCAACSAAAAISPAPAGGDLNNHRQLPGWRSSRTSMWCGSWYSIRIPSLKFVGQRRRKKVWDGGGGQNQRRSGDGSPPAGSRGEAPLRGLGDKVPKSWRIFKVVTSKFYAFFGSISHILTYICYIFSVLAGIIPLSLRNGGIWYRLPPPPCLQVGGTTAPSAPRLRRLCRRPSRSAYMADFRSWRWAHWWPWPVIFWPLNGVTDHPC